MSQNTMSTNKCLNLWSFLVFYLGGECIFLVKMIHMYEIKGHIVCVYKMYKGQAFGKQGCILWFQCSLSIHYWETNDVEHQTNQIKLHIVYAKTQSIDIMANPLVSTFRWAKFSVMKLVEESIRPWLVLEYLWKLSRIIL
jgi:hypothetical protein